MSIDTKWQGHRPEVAHVLLGHGVEAEVDADRGGVLLQAPERPRLLLEVPDLENNTFS